MTLIFATSTAIALGLASIAVWAPRRPRVRIAALALFAAAVPLGFAGWSDLLSRPKPVALEWVISQDEAEVISGFGVENVGIWLWLRFADIAEPRSYELPWSRQTAEQLQKAQEEAGEGGTVRMRFERS
jgi:hypothetical protein